MTSNYIVPPRLADNWRQVADADPTLTERVTVAEWWIR
jgi:hypothetical protein